MRLWSECTFFIVSGRVGWARYIFVHKGKEGLEIRTFCIPIAVYGGRTRVMEWRITDAEEACCETWVEPGEVLYVCDGDIL